ncbi:MAG: BrnT family toxin [Acidobacteria bacterium]|nr:BrnT family toxin [Acidobacteriota bacterium]
MAIMRIKFEWDEHKNKKNIVQHGVPFEIAELAFDDPYYVQTFDRTMEYGEERLHLIGKVEEIALLLVVHTWKEEQNGQIYVRIISARAADRKEKTIYKAHLIRR